VSEKQGLGVTVEIADDIYKRCSGSQQLHMLDRFVPLIAQGPVTLSCWGCVHADIIPMQGYKHSKLVKSLKLPS
jgi:hypothetical protein